MYVVPTFYLALLFTHGAAQFKLLNTCVSCTQHNTFFISLVYMHVCTTKIDDVEALMQSTHRHVCMIICTSIHACQLHTVQTWFSCTLV